MKKNIITITIFLFFVGIVNAQTFKNTSIAIGLTTTTIMGNNPASKSIFPSSNADPIIIGGGFYGAQPGLEVRITVPIDEDNRWRIPFGFDNQFFSATERVPEGANIEDRVSHTLNILTPYVGVSYVLQDLKYLKAKTYVSLEFTTSMIQNIDYRLTRNYFFLNQLDTTAVFPTKGNTIRYGGLIRAGVEGYLFYPLQINASVGFTLVNALGRDNQRSELLTPTHYLETRESYLWNFVISFLFQYTI